MKMTERMVVVIGLAIVMILGLSAKVFLAKAYCFDRQAQCASSGLSNVANDPNAGGHGCH